MQKPKNMLLMKNPQFLSNFAQTLQRLTFQWVGQILNVWAKLDKKCKFFTNSIFLGFCTFLWISLYIFFFFSKCNFGGLPVLCIFLKQTKFNLQQHCLLLKLRSYIYFIWKISSFRKGSNSANLLFTVVWIVSTVVKVSFWPFYLATRLVRYATN